VFLHVTPDELYESINGLSPLFL
jgi:hypothetical protein